jgi:large subunit ribosomal protein L15
MELSNLRPAAGSNDTKFRRGRGHASGNGKTAGFGHKGQKARSGRPRAGFEGGQMPLYRRLPKRGFKNYNKKNIVTVDITKLEKFENDAVVDIQALLDAGIISDVFDGVKVIGNGELTKKLTVKVDAFSAGAKEKIEALGGTAEIAE